VLGGSDTISVCIDRYFNLFVTAESKRNIETPYLFKKEFLTGSQINKGTVLIDPEEGGSA